MFQLEMTELCTPFLLERTELLALFLLEMTELWACSCWRLQSSGPVPAGEDRALYLDPA
jgi:hypothetical protein